MDSRKFVEKLKENNVDIVMMGSRYYVSANDLQEAWERGKLEFVDKPPVSIHEVLERACGRGSTEEDWLKLRDEVSKRGVINRG